MRNKIIAIVFGLLTSWLFKGDQYDEIVVRVYSIPFGMSASVVDESELDYVREGAFYYVEIRRAWDVNDFIELQRKVAEEQTFRENLLPKRPRIVIDFYNKQEDRIMNTMTLYESGYITTDLNQDEKAAYANFNASHYEILSQYLPKETELWWLLNRKTQ